MKHLILIAMGLVDGLIQPLGVSRQRLDNWVGVEHEVVVFQRRSEPRRAGERLLAMLGAKKRKRTCLDGWAIVLGRSDH